PPTRANAPPRTEGAHAMATELRAIKNYAGHRLSLWLSTPVDRTSAAYPGRGHATAAVRRSEYSSPERRRSAPRRRGIFKTVGRPIAFCPHLRPHLFKRKRQRTVGQETAGQRCQYLFLDSPRLSQREISDSVNSGPPSRTRTS